MLDATPEPSTSPALHPDEPFRQHAALLTDMARKYIWWMQPEEALHYPARVVAQVMNMGVFRDASRVAETLGDDCLRKVLQTAEAGWFNARSWHYWHYRLGLAAVDQVPPLPERRIA
jgi:hypothetical protein